MVIKDLKTNHVKNPVGYAMTYPVFSWKVADASGQKQAKAKIRVALDEKMEHIVCEKEDETLESSGTKMIFDVKSGQTYYWNVCVMDENGGCAISETAFFVTPIGKKDWRADWIGSGNEKINGVLFKDFDVIKKVKKAWLFISGVGFYEPWCNGQKIGDEYLTPGINDYHSWIQFQTYPMEAHLTTGKNHFEILLGNGWYKKSRDEKKEGPDTKPYGKYTAAIAQIKIEYEDGTTDIIMTDTSWKIKKSKIIHDNIYDGEILDDSLSDTTCQPVKCIPVGYDKLQARLSLPVKVMEKRRPIELIHTKNGEIVLDFGQNMAGWPVFFNRLPKGAVCKYTAGEILQDGYFYHDNMGTAKTEFTYISGGQMCWVRPHFTCFGFRYIKLEGFGNTVDLHDFEAWVLYSEMERIGSIVTGNPMLNQLISNILWSQKSNFLDVPTDCPQRDERMGWTGDAQVFSATAMFNMDCSAFFRKYMHDMLAEQRKHDGAVPTVIPNVAPHMQISAGWSDAAVIIPWNCYKMYGDKELLSEQYENMKAWTEYMILITQKEDCPYLWKNTPHFGDWLASDSPGFLPVGLTDMGLIASTYYYICTKLTGEAAKILNKDTDAKKYTYWEQQIKDAFLNEYYSGSGRLISDTQTAYVLVLYSGLVPKGDESFIFEQLLRKLRENNYQLTTGFIGTPLICNILSKYGRSDLVYKILLDDTRPGWLYSVRLGATTVWERFDGVLPDGHMNSNGMNSLNHYANGSIQEWMYRYMLGFTTSSRGWKSFKIQPYPNRDIHFARGIYDSVYGKIVSTWEFLADGRISYHFEIPFNCRVELIVGECGGKLPEICCGSYGNVSVSWYDEADDTAHYQVYSGSYEIDYIPVSSAGKKFHCDCTLEELLKDERAYQVIKTITPKVLNLNDNIKQMSLWNSIFLIFTGYTVNDFYLLDKKLREI